MKGKEQTKGYAQRKSTRPKRRQSPDGQNQTPTFLRRQKRAPQKRWGLRRFSGFTGEQRLLRAYSDRTQTPKTYFPPSPPAETEQMRFRILGPKGYDTLQPVSVKSLLAWEVKKGFPNTAVYKTVLVSYEVKEGSHRAAPSSPACAKKNKIQIASPPRPSVQSKLHTRATISDRPSGGEQRREYKRERL